MTALRRWLLARLTAPEVAAALTSAGESWQSWLVRAPDGR